MRTRLSMLLLITTAAMTTPAWGKQVDLLPHELVNTATHVVVGDVVAVYERRATEGDWKVARYLAELRVSNAEQGDGIENSDLIYTRYRQRRWAGKGRVPWTTSGHHGLPSEGDTVRVYLACHADDGFHRANHDGGLNVMGANGFEQLKHVTIESRPQLDVCTGTGGYIGIRGNPDALLLPSVRSLFPIEIHWHRVEHRPFCRELLACPAKTQHKGLPGLHGHERISLVCNLPHGLPREYLPVACGLG